MDSLPPRTEVERALGSPAEPASTRPAPPASSAVAPRGEVPLLEVPPTPDERLRRWLAASLGNRITATAALLTIGVVLTLGALAYAHAHALLARNATTQLEGQARLLAHGLELSLASAARDVESLATNTLFTNALLDAGGRDGYLQPFMRDYRLPQPVRFSLMLTNHRGARLVSTDRDAAADYRQAPWLATVIDGGTVHAALTEGEAPRLLLAQPVVYPGTGKAEGMLVLELDLLDVLRVAAAPLADDSRKALLAGERSVAAVTGDQGQAVEPSTAARGSADWIRARQSLQLTGALAGQKIVAEVGARREAALAGLSGLAGTFALAGLLALGIVIALARVVSRRIAAPLWRLSRAADRVRREQRLDITLPAAGDDEVGRLTQSLEHMMDSLRAARETLESQVTTRTAALTSAQARLAALLDNMRDGVLMIDADDTIESINRGGERLFGVASAAVVGAHAALLIPGWQKTVMAIRRGTSAASRPDDARVVEVIAQRDDVTFQAELSISRTFLDGALHWVVVVRDVTERTRAAETMAQSNRKLLEVVGELRTRDRHMGQINRMNEMLQCCQSSAEAYRVIDGALRELFSGARGALAVMGADGRALETVLRWGEAAGESEFAVQDCWALRRGHTHRSAPGGVCCAHYAAGGDGAGDGAALCLPLSVRGETLGLLTVHLNAGPLPSAAEPSENEPDAVHAHERELQLLAVVGEAIKFALSNLKLRDALREAALRDRLTGLYNRRYLDETLAREMHRARRAGKPLTLAMLDLDHFKRFNDQYGHEAGDLVLREVGRILATGLRASDIACRYGGEELTAVLPDADLAVARERLEEIRSAVRQLKLHHGGQPLPTVTVSIGVAQAAVSDSPARLMRVADEALYRAKADGRDRVALAAPQPLAA
jgi:diguanylate cyclase (GGDEF)-like protein/PAS domain S-box-containing protein